MQVEVVVILVLLATDLWVVLDVVQRRGRGEQVESPWLWLVALVLAWIFFFPYYWVKRARSPRASQALSGADRAQMPTTSATTTTQLDSAHSVADEISKLAALRNQGHLSASEFEAAKSSLLAAKAPLPEPRDGKLASQVADNRTPGQRRADMIMNGAAVAGVCGAIGVLIWAGLK